MKAHWQTVAIVGVGMIGGSIGKALLMRRLANRVIGVGRTRESIEGAKRAGAVTETTVDLAAVAGADLVVIAAGVAAIQRLLDDVDAAVDPGTLITDTGSTKASIVAAWERRRRSRRGRFVGAHPIAGSHRRGPAAADPALFAGRVAVVTPAAATPAGDVAAVSGFWSALGASVVTMAPREHDRILAATSHAPHVVAAAVVAATPPAAHRFTAGGWRDTTRIAAGDPELWADILIDNAGPVVGCVRRVSTAAARMVAAIEAGDRRRLVSLLKRAKDERDAVGS